MAAEAYHKAFRSSVDLPVGLGSPVAFHSSVDLPVGLNFPSPAHYSVHLTQLRTLCRTRFHHSSRFRILDKSCFIPPFICVLTTISIVYNIRSYVNQ